MISKIDGLIKINHQQATRLDRRTPAHSAVVCAVELAPWLAGADRRVISSPLTAEGHWLHMPIGNAMSTDFIFICCLFVPIRLQFAVSTFLIERTWTARRARLAHDWVCFGRGTFQNQNDRAKRRPLVPAYGTILEQIWFDSNQMNWKIDAIFSPFTAMQVYVSFLIAFWKEFLSPDGITLNSVWPLLFLS